jgi:hypothetical protein
MLDVKPHLTPKASSSPKMTTSSCEAIVSSLLDNGNFLFNKPNETQHGTSTTTPPRQQCLSHQQHTIIGQIFTPHGVQPCSIHMDTGHTERDFFTHGQVSPPLPFENATQNNGNDTWIKHAKIHEVPNNLVTSIHEHASQDHDPGPIQETNNTITNHLFATIIPALAKYKRIKLDNS